MDIIIYLQSNLGETVLENGVLYVYRYPNDRFIPTALCLTW